MMQYAAPPESADLFVYFERPYEPPFHNYTAADTAAIHAMGAESITTFGNDEKLALRVSCDLQLGRKQNLMRELTHLTPLTAHQHLVVPRWRWTDCSQGIFAHSAPPRALRRLLVTLETDSLHGTELALNRT